MNRYRFRLEPVLRVRRIQQDAAQGVMVAARRDLDAAEVLLRESFERYHALDQSTPGLPTADWLAARSGTERCAATVVATGISRQAAESHVEEQRRALREARMRVAALERLDERRRDEHAVAARRADDADIDELVTNRHGRTS